MPIISSFYGIKITMYYNDHVPPHFHAEYNGHKALIDIENAQVISGSLPNNQLRLVIAWATIHRQELFRNWKRTQEEKTLKDIKPLS